MSAVKNELYPRHRAATFCPSLAAVFAFFICTQLTPAEDLTSHENASTPHPALRSAGTRSFTLHGTPGDPLNIAFIGTEEELLHLMADAHWDPADAITWRSSLRITFDSVVRRPYIDAPVSSLYVNGKKQDLAFEQPAATNPSKRHHVRFWRMDPPDRQARPLWIGAATYDTRIGFSHVNGHITHHIAPDVDTERDKLIADAQQTGGISVLWVPNFQPALVGRNGGGDPFHTDGKLAVLTVETVAPLK